MEIRLATYYARVKIVIHEMFERLLLIYTKIQLAVSTILTLNLFSFTIFILLFLQKNIVLMNIHEYTNKLI